MQNWLWCKVISDTDYLALSMDLFACHHLVKLIRYTKRDWDSACQSELQTIFWICYGCSSKGGGYQPWTLSLSAEAAKLLLWIVSKLTSLALQGSTSRCFWSMQPASSHTMLALLNEEKACLPALNCLMADVYSLDHLYVYLCTFQPRFRWVLLTDLNVLIFVQGELCGRSWRARRSRARERETKIGAGDNSQGMVKTQASPSSLISWSVDAFY